MPKERENIVVKNNMGKEDKKFSAGFACGVIVVVVAIAIRQSWYWDHAFMVVSLIIAGQVLTVMFKYLALIFFGAWAGNDALIKIAEKAFDDYCNILE